jgi:hypothetical protein
MYNPLQAAEIVPLAAIGWIFARWQRGAAKLGSSPRSKAARFFE